MIAAFGQVDYMHISTLDSLRERWAQRIADHILIFLDRPDSKLTSILTQISAPILYVTDDPMSCALYLAIDHDQSPEMAARNTNASLAMVYDLYHNAKNIYAIPAVEGTDAKLLSVYIHEALDLTDFYPIEAIGADLEANRGPESQSLADERSSNAARELRDLSDAFLPFIRSGIPARVERMIWPTQLFMTTDPIGAPYIDHIDLVGPARVLLYGPYLHLPIGRWRMTVEIQIENNESGNQLKAELAFDLDTRVCVSGPLPARTHAEFQLDFEIVEPREAVQLRLILLQGAIEGEFRLLRVAVARSDA